MLELPSRCLRDRPEPPRRHERDEEPRSIGPLPGDAFAEDEGQRLAMDSTIPRWVVALHGVK